MQYATIQAPMMYTYTGIDPKTNTPRYSATMIQVEAPSLSASNRPKTRASSKPKSASTSSRIKTRSQSGKVGVTRYRMDFDIDDEDESDSEACRDYDQQRPSSHSNSKKRQNKSSDVSKKRLRVGASNRSGVSDGETELATPSFVRLRKKKTPSGGEPPHGALDHEEEVAKELDDIMQDIQEGNGNGLPTPDEILNHSTSSQHYLRRTRAQSKEGEKQTRRLYKTRDSHKSKRSTKSHDQSLDSESELAFMCSEGRNDSQTIDSQRGTPSSVDDDSDYREGSPFESKSSHASGESLSKKVFHDFAEDENGVLIEHDEHDSSPRSPSSSSSGSPISQSPVPESPHSDATQEEAKSLLSLSNPRQPTNRAVASHPVPLQPTLSSSSISDTESLSQSVPVDTTITITSSTQFRSSSSSSSSAKQSSFLSAHSQALSQSRNQHRHLHQQQQQTHPPAPQRNHLPHSHHAPLASSNNLFPTVSSSFLACEHMDYTPLSKLAQMSDSEVHEMNNKQLCYGSTTWQNHRDFFSKRLSVRARALVPTLIGDIVWPDVYEDFANTIKRRYQKNPEPSKRMSYDFSEAVSLSTAPDSFSRNKSQLEARQTAVERKLQDDISCALTDNLQKRQTQRNFLLLGEPGCGKTSMVEQVAIRMGLPRISITADAIMSKFVGETGKQLVAMFEVFAALQPIVLVMDECESIYRTREDANADDYRRDLLTQLLPRLADNLSAICGLVIVSMTNCPDRLDKAIVSRFMGNTIEVKLTEEVRFVVWYNQLHSNTFVGLDNMDALTRLSRIPISDLRIISDICKKCRNEVFRIRRYRQPLVNTQNLEMALIDIGNPNSIIWSYVQPYLRK